MFGEDPFTGIEDLFNHLAGSRRGFSQGRRAATQNLLSTIESKKETILVFDLSGKKVVSVNITDELEANEYGERLHTGQKNLSINFENQDSLRYNLPKSLAKRKINYTFKNGILEVSLRK